MSKGIPASNGAFRDWEVNFLSLCVANATVWQLAAIYLTTLQASQSIWAAAWAIVSTGNCTPAQRQAMRDAKADYIELLRPFIQTQIVYNPNISDAQRIELGVPPRKDPSPVPVPETVPVVELLPDYVHKMTVYFKQQPDAEGQSRRAKPDGVSFMELAYSVDTVPSDPDDCPNRMLVSRSPLTLTFDASQAGKKVYVYSRWINSRGEAGEYTNVNEFIIP